MKLNFIKPKKTALEKLTSTYDVKLDASASQLIMDVLAKLYDNPVEAAIREYVSNAYDANVEAGSTEPVHLHVPTQDEPYLQVSDTGNGLDYLGIVSVFANFGTSTKRDSNEFIGGFGIGSKSGLAISNRIRVSSVCNGILNEFVIERKNGILQTRFIVENKETSSPNGTTVTINLRVNFILNFSNFDLKRYHYVIKGWSNKEVIVTNKDKNCQFLNDDRVPDTYRKIPNTDTWLTSGDTDCTNPTITDQYVRIGRVLYRIPYTIVKKVPCDNIGLTNMVHDIHIGELPVNYAREKLDVSDDKTIKKLIDIIKKAYKAYVKEYNDITKRTDIDVPTKLRKLREYQYPFNSYDCLEDCDLNQNQHLPFRYTAYEVTGPNAKFVSTENMLNDEPDLFILDNKGLSHYIYADICSFLYANWDDITKVFPGITNNNMLYKQFYGVMQISFCDSAALYWHINSDTLPVINIEDILKYISDDDNEPDNELTELAIKNQTVFNMNNKFAAIELQDLPDNADTHVINDNSNDYLDKVYDFVLPANNHKVITCTKDNDEIDWILQNKPNVSYFTKADMVAKADTIATIVEPLLKNDNALYVVKMLVKNKQLSSNIAMLHLDTAQDTEAYLKALYRASRRYETKSHNLSFDQKLFIDALCVKGIKIMGKKDAAKIVKRLKLLFPDELKLLKDTADEIVHNVQF